MNNEYLTSKEVRDLFKIAPSTLYNWRKTNKINFIKINAKKVLYKKDDVEKLLKKEKHISRLNIIYV